MPSSELLAALELVKAGEFESKRKHGEALIALMRACNTELIELTYKTNGVSWIFVAKELCRDFVLRAYFGGKWPPVKDVKSRYHIESLTTKVLTCLRERIGGTEKSPMYEDEVETLRGMLEDTEKVCFLVETSLSDGERMFFERLRKEV